MDDLTEKQLKILHGELIRLRDELILLLDISSEAGDTVVLDQTKVGRLSRMDAMQQQEMSQACRAGYQQRLKDVQYVLSNLDQGEYGWCELCGEAIDFRRLEVKPESRFCVGCQQSVEGS